MADQNFNVMTSSNAKALLAKKGILMPWQEGYDEQVSKRTPDAAEKVAEITKREEANLEGEQVKKIKKAMKTEEGGPQA